MFLVIDISSGSKIFYKVELRFLDPNGVKNSLGRH